MKERYQVIEEKNGDLKEILAKKKPIVQEFLERFEMSWVYHDSALEGTVYAPNELQAALYPGAVAAEASLMPIVWEIRNHKNCLDYVRAEAKAATKKTPAVTLAQIRRMHDLVSGNTDEAQVAKAAIDRREKSDKELAKERDRMGLRKDMPLHRTYFHEIAQPSKIASMLDKLADFVASAEFREYHPIQQAAHLQYSVIGIFPFTENSGKVGRMCSNLVLLRHGYFPSVVHAIERQKYYETFRGSPLAFRNFFMDSIENSLDNALKYFREQTRRYRAVTY